MLGSLLRTALEVVAPDACVVCQLPGPCLCDECSRRLEPVCGPLCRACGHPWELAVASCRACLPGLPPARAGVLYDQRARRLISGLKDGGRRRLAEPLAHLIVEAIPRPDVEALVPVPVGRRRLAERGFNQCGLIAGALAEVWDIPILDSLRREHDGPPQRGRSGRARRAAMSGVFVASIPAPGSACLVDDVHTTGATLAACAHALRMSGSAHVSAVTVARTPMLAPSRS
jgi:ComF family protein